MAIGGANKLTPLQKLPPSLAFLQGEKMLF